MLTPGFVLHRLLRCLHTVGSDKEARSIIITAPQDLQLQMQTAAMIINCIYTSQLHAAPGIVLEGKGQLAQMSVTLFFAEMNVLWKLASLLHGIIEMGSWPTTLLAT